ncbi:hypothetical protein ABBQ38_013870 [Trebouxia sp. C0009 RCD-2024]
MGAWGLRHSLAWAAWTSCALVKASTQDCSGTGWLLKYSCCGFKQHMTPTLMYTQNFINQLQRNKGTCAYTACNHKCSLTCLFDTSAGSSCGAAQAIGLVIHHKM